MLDNKQLIQINEYFNKEIEKLDIPFTDEEISIIENEFYNKLEIIFKYHGKVIIKTQQYIGYIILPNHIIKYKSPLWYNILVILFYQIT